MRKEKRGVFAAVESYLDMLINLACIIAGYVFAVAVIKDRNEINIFHPIGIALIFFNILFASFVYHITELYKSDRYMRAFRSFPAVLRANAVYFGIMTVAVAFAARVEYRQTLLFWILFSALLSTAVLTLKRYIIKSALRIFRSRKNNMRRVILIGDNTPSAADYIREVSSDSQYGITVVGYVGNKIDGGLLGVERLGGFSSLADILDRYQPTDAVFAIDSYDKASIIRLVNICDDRCIKVNFLPVIYGFFKNSGQIEQLGTVPLINIHSTPLDNPANSSLKRIIDVIGSLLLIIITLPVMLFAALGVYFSSPGPILFKQKRVGKLGKSFNMLKFRSMRVNEDSNRAWTTGNDPRKTRFGTFLRRTAIDELPQFFNVLGGSMSLVGPRPEIPVFVEHFKETVPLYMIKHYVKPGITGLAQIKGFRGDTSIEARIQEDIEYIENWSLWLDIVILLKTPFKAFNKNEKYVVPKSRETKNKEGKYGE